MAEPVDKRYVQIACGLAATLVALVGSFWAPGLSAGFERSILDLTQKWVGAKHSHNVAVIAIDADSKTHLGEWPWPNSLHAQLIEQLRAAGSKTVIFTTPLDDSRGTANLDRVRAAMAILQSPDFANTGRAEELRKLLSGSVDATDDDRQLTRAMAAHGQVFLPVEVSLDASMDGDHSEPFNARNWAEADDDALSEAPAARLIGAPSTLLAAARGVGHLASPVDSDGVMRRELAAVRIGDRLLPALSVAAAIGSAGNARFTGNTLAAGDGLPEISLDKDLGFTAHNPPVSGAAALPRYSYWEVLAGKVDAAVFAGKTVVIGVTDGSSADRLTTPTAHAVPRAIVLGGVVQSLLHNDLYRHSAGALALQILLYLGVIAAAAWALPKLNLVNGAIGTSAIIGALLSLEVAVLSKTGLWLQLTLACLALTLAYLTRAAIGSRWSVRGSRATLGASPDGLRTLALTLQGQGQLELAYETFRRCPVDTTTLDLLYRLGADFERRRQLSKAADVYAHIAKLDANYRDATEKSVRLAQEKLAVEPAVAPAVKPVLAAPRPAPQPAKNTPVKPKAAPSSTPKETLGRYEIERQIGKGAMGVVYLGRDPKINRIVAIKAIPLAEEFEDADLAEARERFFREAEMAGRLNHPGIVTVYDAGEDRGLAYIAMEFLRGEHLSFYAEPQNLLPIRKVLQLVTRLADALDYAHRQNVIHRDIKPANIMFNVETDMLKITDFGIARLTDVSKTKTGIVLGTPSFMSPEQLEGRPIDGRSDLFALGVTLYQLLSAQLPFRADSMTRLMNKIATEPHTPIRSIRPELPAATDGILERALAKTEEGRYHTGAEMAEALRACLRTLES